MLQREHHEQANVDEERACGVGSQAETAQLHEAGHRQNQDEEPRHADRVGKDREQQYARTAGRSALLRFVLRIIGHCVNRLFPGVQLMVPVIVPRRTGQGSAHGCCPTREATPVFRFAGRTGRDVR